MGPFGTGGSKKLRQWSAGCIMNRVVSVRWNVAGGDDAFTWCGSESGRRLCEDIVNELINVYSLINSGWCYCKSFSLLGAKEGMRIVSILARMCFLSCMYLERRSF